MLARQTWPARGIRHFSHLHEHDGLQSLLLLLRAQAANSSKTTRVSEPACLVLLPRKRPLSCSHGATPQCLPLQKADASDSCSVCAEFPDCVVLLSAVVAAPKAEATDEQYGPELNLVSSAHKAGTL